MKEDNRYRCVVCGKLRKVNFLKKMNNSWVCNHDITGSNYAYVKHDSMNQQVHYCRLLYIESKLKVLHRAINDYNESLISVNLINDVLFFSCKIDIPEPAFLLQLLKKIK